MPAHTFTPARNGDTCPHCHAKMQKRRLGVWCRNCDVYFTETALPPLDESALRQREEEKKNAERLTRHLYGNGG